MVKAVLEDKESEDKESEAASVAAAARRCTEMQLVFGMKGLARSTAHRPVGCLEKTDESPLVL